MGKQFMLITFFIGMFLSMYITPAFAQQPPQADIEAIQGEIETLVSKKIEHVLRKDQAKADKMKADLQEVEKQDNNGRKKALENFNRAHKAHYQKSMHEAGVNMQDVIARLSKRFPAYDFSIADDFGIAFSPKENIGTGYLQYLQNDNEATDFFAYGKGPQTKTNAGQDDESTYFYFQELTFTGNRSVNCAVASGGNAEIGTRHVRTTSTGVVAGGCTSTGRLNSSTSIPRGQNVTGRITANLEIGCTAFAIIGTSVASAHTNIQLRCTENQQYFGTASKFKTVIAPILWYASFTESGSVNWSPSLTALQGKTFVADVYCSSSATSIMCCGTSSYARLNITTARFEVTP